VHFWAKTDLDGKPGISVFEHMVNVGCVAHCIADCFPELLERFQLTASIVGALAALHDLGKISPGFQRKSLDWLIDNNLLTIDRNGCWDTLMEADHGKTSHAAIQTYLFEKGIDRTTAKYVSTVIGAHHGRLNRPSDRGYLPNGAITETHSNIDWSVERMANARMVWEYFSANGDDLKLSDNTPSLWWLAGVISVADWIGSDERFFPSNKNEGSSDNYAIAKHALDVIGLCKPKITGDLSFHDLLHDQQKPEEIWTPNEMQKKTLSMVNGPGVYIIEAPMGMGKTEAALWAAYNLLVAGKVLGIYFALPTQVTSNRIYIRLNDYLERIAPAAPASRLIHANSWLMSDDHGIYPARTEHRSSSSGDARRGRDW
jgi:CRISPR-associated endonuclease/helicase Cas3